MSDLYTRFDSVFFEKTRLSIITLLAREPELSYNRLKELLGLSDGALYAHLEKLRDGGYIDRTKRIVDDAVSSQYRLTDFGRQTFTDYVQVLEQMIRVHSPRKDVS